MVRFYSGDVHRFAIEYASQIKVDRIKNELDALKAIVHRKKRYQKYIDSIKKWLDNGLLEAGPSLLKSIMDDFASQSVDTKVKFGNIPFYKLILNAMGYSKALHIYRRFVPKMGIKTCVYCNAQYAITFTKRGNKQYAQFEIDHWRAKDKYPFLCVSFFNFVPSCPSCNKHKSNSDIAFSIYSDVSREMAGDEYDPFVFKVPDVNLALFLNSFRSDVLKLAFKSKNGDAELEREYDRFAINEMYELFIDEAALSIMRFIFYSEAYRKQLQESYASLFTKSLPFDEFIYGVSFKKNEVLRRPLTKMIQDIRSQLETSSEYFNWMKRHDIIS